MWCERHYSHELPCVACAWDECADLSKQLAAVTAERDEARDLHDIDRARMLAAQARAEKLRAALERIADIMGDRQHRSPRAHTFEVIADALEADRTGGER